MQFIISLGETLGDVEDGQFFITTSGYLCQKVEEARYNVVAGPGGDLLAGATEEWDEGVPIRRVLNDVVGIDFG